MATVRRFEELKVWQKSRDFCREISVIIKQNNTFDDRSFFDQLRSSSGSVMDNIAEGFGRSSKKEFIQFLFIANGSLMESRSQLYRALDYGYLAAEELAQLTKQAEELSSMIFGLCKYLQKTLIAGQKHKQ